MVEMDSIPENPRNNTFEDTCAKADASAATLKRGQNKTGGLLLLVMEMPCK